MGKLIERVERLFPFAYSVAGAGNDAAVEVMQGELPSFNLREYPSGAENNGWRVSPAMTVEKAEIRKRGELIYDGTDSPLGVMALSDSFTGRIGLDELREHLFYSDENPDAVVYHSQQLYRTASKTWGFCLPKRLYDAMTPGDYDVDLRTRLEPVEMKVLDAVLPGKTDATVLFNAHNCHPFQANDDLSGVAVGIELMQRLAEWPNRRFTYRLLVAPELIGPQFWIDDIGKEAETIQAAVMLKSVGNDADLKLQDSFTSQDRLDIVAHHVFKHRYGEYESGPFRTVYGNDETVFEAPGYAIPTASVTRYPFPTYHTDRDTPDTLSEDRLQDTVDTVLGICTALESDRAYRAKFKGLLCLSHEKYQLYQQVWDPSLRDGAGRDSDRRWNRLMTYLPRLMDGKTRLIDIAEQFDLPIAEVAAYVEKWVEKGLAEPVD